MKITFLSSFYPYRGGIAQFSASLLRALEAENQVKSYTFRRQYPNFLFPGKTQFVEKSDTADKINAVRSLDTLNPLTYLKTARLISKDSPDFFITSYWMSFFAPSFGFISLKMRKKCKVIAILHNVKPHENRFFDRILNTFFIKKNDAFIVMSESVLKDLLAIHPKAKYLKLNHPIYSHFTEKLPAVAAKEKLGLNPTAKTLLFFGIIRDYKGLDLLLEAFDKLDDSYQLIIAGETYGDFSRYQKAIDESANKKNIHLFNRYIKDDEVALYYSAADVCVLPYKSATQSGITSIAHHFELPIIATDVGGLKETILHQKTGWIVEKPNAELIKQAIETYFSSNRKDEMAAYIRTENEQNSWSNFAKQLTDFASSIQKP